MSVWTALNKRNIGPGVSSNARPMMPTLNMESLDKDDDYNGRGVAPDFRAPRAGLVQRPCAESVQNRFQQLNPSST